jgi:hypothetical protein
MPAAPHPRRHYWSLPEAIAWRRRWQPACSHQQAIDELWDLLVVGPAEAIAVAKGPNPLWSDARKADFERENLGARVIISKALLAELWLMLDVDPRTGAAVGSVEWTGSGIVAFSDPWFDRDKLIVAWRDKLIAQRRAAPPEPVQEATAEPVQEATDPLDDLYRQRAEEHGILDGAGKRRILLNPSKRHPNVQCDMEWAKENGVSRAKLQNLRKKHGTAHAHAGPLKIKTE